MDVDEDGPPMLVAADSGFGADAVGANLSADTSDVTLAKVPISIITGRTPRASRMPIRDPVGGVHLSGTLIDLALHDRLPWSRQDHIVKLHSYSSAWQEDCGHPERYGCHPRSIPTRNVLTLMQSSAIVAT